MKMVTHKARKGDEVFLWDALYEAAHMDETGDILEEAKTNPDLSRYVEDWGKKHDVGIIVEDAESNISISAAWVRMLNGNTKGYGYVRDGIPELAMATLSKYRGKGAGVLAIKSLIECLHANYPGISLNVRTNNHPAINLYKKVGFKKIPGSEVENRVGGQSLNMILEF